MLILFDHGTPLGVSRVLSNHSVVTAHSRGWSTLSNGKLLQAAEDAGFDLLLTTDGGIRYQQNLSGRKIAIIVLTGSTKWSRVRMHLNRISSLVDAAIAGATLRFRFLFGSL